jgi:hypothetical protein
MGCIIEIYPLGEALYVYGTYSYNPPRGYLREWSGDLLVFYQNNIPYILAQR